MKRDQLPITALQAFAKLNDISFEGVGVRDLGEKGFGLAAERQLDAYTTGSPNLLHIPHVLILCAETIEEHAKFDQHFRQLLDTAGGKSFRGDALLFLLMQITIASPHHGESVGLSNPWTEYCKMLPSVVPVPTMWMEEERDLLFMGTSLEYALNAKMVALSREFEALREKTANIQWCQKCWWSDEGLDFMDYVLVDAWYRSRSLELPNSGESMIPCLDMVNHSNEAGGFYEETATTNDVTLQLHHGVKLDTGSEVTISYGASKSQAEMIFSYGFIDGQSTTREMVLTLDTAPDDPLGKAKLAAFSRPPTVRIHEKEGVIAWDGPFLYLMCLNEEDGLDFGTLQETDGSCSQLRVLWQGSDVTDAADSFESLISSHELKDVFRLRVAVLLQDRIQQQAERLMESEETAESKASGPSISPGRSDALKLRRTEATLLEEAYIAVEMQKNKLLESENVLRYLQSMAAGNEEHNNEPEDSNGDDDFS